MKSKILLTGGSGFLGSSLALSLAQKGNKIVIFDNNFRGSFLKFSNLNKRNISFFKGDIRDQKSLIKASKGCTEIYHLAFINGTSNFYERPKLVLDVGIKGILNVIELCNNSKNIKKLIYASSSEVYNKPKKIPASEKEFLVIPDPHNPRFSYSGGKIIGELVTLNYLKLTKIKHCIFRPHNIFGPNMGLEHVIPQIINKIYIASNGLKKRKCKINIQGNGNETRSFCFVDDAIKQIEMIGKKGKNREIYNIGQNKEISINKLINDISKILRIKIETRKSKLNLGSVKRRCPDIKKIKNICEFDNNYLKGLKVTVDWYKKFYKNDKKFY